MTEVPQKVANVSSVPRQDSGGNIIVGCDLHSRVVVLQPIRYENGHIEKVSNPIHTSLPQFYNTCRTQIPTGTVIVIEASGNSFRVADKLEEIGYNPIIVKSDTVSRMERSDHVNDSIDAFNLARAVALGLAKEVYRPTKTDLIHRDMILNYHDTSKELTTVSNKIWSFCHCNNITLPPPHVCHASKLKFIENMLKTLELDDYSRYRLQNLFNIYKSLYEYKMALTKKIAVVVAKDRRMLDAMTLLGIGMIMAFALVSYIGDINRFKASSKLVAYFGLNPVCNESGESKSPHRLSQHGNRFIKAMLIESLKNTMRIGNTTACIWAKKKIRRGKNRNIVLCALARKTLTYLFHVLKDKSTPNRETGKTYYDKLIKLAHSIGQENVEASGCCRAHDFAWRVIKPCYAELPHNKPEDCAPLEPPKRKPPAKKAVPAA